MSFSKANRITKLQIFTSSEIHCKMYMMAISDFVRESGTVPCRGQETIQLLHSHNLTLYIPTLRCAQTFWTLMWDSCTLMAIKWNFLGSHCSLFLGVAPCWNGKDNICLRATCFLLLYSQPSKIFDPKWWSNFIVQQDPIPRRLQSKNDLLAHSWLTHIHTIEIFINW